MSVWSKVMLSILSNQQRLFNSAANLMRSFGGKLQSARSQSWTGRKKNLGKKDKDKMLGRKPLKQIDSNGMYMLTTKKYYNPFLFLFFMIYFYFIFTTPWPLSFFFYRLLVDHIFKTLNLHLVCTIVLSFKAEEFDLNIQAFEVLFILIISICIYRSREAWGSTPPPIFVGKIRLNI